MSPFSLSEETIGFGCTTALVNGVQQAGILFIDLEAGHDLTDISLAVGVESLGPTQNDESFEFPCAKIDVTAVVEDDGVIGQEHHEPVLRIGEAVILGCEIELTWIGNVIALHVGVEPNLSSIDSSEAVESMVIDLTILDVESRYLTVEAVIDRVPAFNDVPATVQFFISDAGNGVGRIAAGGVVQRIGRRK